MASAGAVAVVGFCWGGSLAWRMGCDKASGLAAAISYYGGELPPRSHQLKRIFMMLGTVLTVTIAASMMQMRLHWLGGGAWSFWKQIWPDNGKG